MSNHYHIQKVGHKVQITQPGYGTQLYSLSEIQQAVKSANPNRKIVLQAAWSMLPGDPPRRENKMPNRVILALFWTVIPPLVLIGAASFVKGYPVLGFFVLVMAGAIALALKWMRS